MKEIKGNLFDFDTIVITTNGIVKRDGSLVMGAGLALEAKKRFKNIEFELGKLVKELGNIPHLINFDNKTIISFPTKHHWKEDSDLQLITRSACLLVMLADLNNINNIYLPKVGCGKGNLNYERQVKSLLKNYLDDRFIICI